MTEHLPPNWINRLGAVLAIPPNGNWAELATAWAQAEGGTATFNPWNTTYELPGATTYNHVGVKNYPTAIEGICATALTLANGAYPGILGDLQGGKLTAQEIVERNEAEFARWGTGAKLILEVLASRKV